MGFQERFPCGQAITWERSPRFKYRSTVVVFYRTVELQVSLCARQKL
jgi:hypothetical protein